MLSWPASLNSAQSNIQQYWPRGEVASMECEHQTHLQASVNTTICPESLQEMKEGGKKNASRININAGLEKIPVCWIFLPNHFYPFYIVKEL